MVERASALGGSKSLIMSQFLDAGNLAPHKNQGYWSYFPFQNDFIRREWAVGRGGLRVGPAVYLLGWRI